MPANFTDIIWDNFIKYMGKYMISHIMNALVEKSQIDMGYIYISAVVCAWWGKEDSYRFH